MDSSSSFKSYINAQKKLEEEDFRRKTRKRLVVISVSAVLLISIVIGVAFGVLAPTRRNHGSTSGNATADSADNLMISSVCKVTLYPVSCISSITALAGSSNFSLHPSPEFVFELSLRVVLNELLSLSSLQKGLMSANGNASLDPSDPLLVQAVIDCENLFDHAIGQVRDCISLFEANQEAGVGQYSDIDSFRTWLSTAITDQQTCLYGLMEARNALGLVGFVKGAMKNSTEFSSNSLAIASQVLPIIGNLPTRKLLTAEQSEPVEWVDESDRRRLLERTPKPDFIVAKDGTGDFSTITEALESIPKRSNEITVIYVKHGTYIENITIDTDHWNVMMYGDGMLKTIVSGHKNYADGTPTYSTATFGADGRGFIAKDMGFRNTAGPEKFQAVALRSSADQAVFFRCYFDAYQDTLYTLAGRQFYRDCLIVGTIDFIFGNSAAVFQNCSIQPRQPMHGQFNAITAQGKSDPNQNTGISIQHCQISPFDNLTAQTYLGRPWQNYSTTVFMQSDIDGFVNLMGWVQWTPSTEPPNTIFYAEYENTGPGSDLEKRVKWPGYRPNISEKQAEQFSVNSFIQGGKWLPKTTILYDVSL